MGVVAKVEDGKIVDNTSVNSNINNTKKNGSTLDKDAFLGLLVAQMRYQDPLEPTSNTEFISQYATFSSLEQMQNMSSAMELSRASTLVGKVVSVNTVNSLGERTTLQGKVDYVVYENNKAFVSIGEKLYSLDDVYAVADQEYLDAFDKAMSFAELMVKLPKLEELSLDDKEVIDKLNKTYKEMTDYQKTFIASDLVKTLEEYTKKMDELVKESGGEGSGGETEGDDKK